MRSGGWKSFWAALFTTLLVLVPLMGGTFLLARRQAAQRLEAAESQSGVPIRLPRASDRMTVLVCVAGEQPAFVLVYLNAEQNCLNLLAIPAQLAVPFGVETASLQECYAAAGPARCLEGVSNVLELPEDTRYLAATADTLVQLLAGYAPLRVGFSGALTAEELALAGRGSVVESWSAAAAHEFLLWLDTEQAVQPQHAAAARAAVWDAFFRQNLELLPARLPDELRDVSGACLTSLTAGDYYTLEETLEFLADNAALVSSAALPGDWDRENYSANDASRAAVQALFNVSPSDAQSESSSAP